MLAIAAVLSGCDDGTKAQAAVRPDTAPKPASIAPPDRPVASGEWTMPARDYANTRYSELSQITTSNVKNLKVATTFSTGVLNGHEGNPLVVGATMYLVTPWPNILYAIDLTKPGGALRWKFVPQVSDRAQGIACCDVVNRGPTFADGKIIYNTLDNQTIAVDTATGKPVWNTRVGDINKGETVTMAPIVAHGKVIVGNAGAELGVRGWILALDVKTGKEVWRAYSTGPDSSTLIGAEFRPFYASDSGKDLGTRSWSGEEWKRGGGTVWGWISYDPALNLIYYGTANPGVWNPDMRPGDNKWSMSIFARDPDNGHAKWAYQITPHDEWDFDGVNENVLLDLPLNGQQRKVLVHPDRNGFIYVMDRTTGQVLSAQQYAPINWATGIDLKTGLPQEVQEKKTHQGIVVRNICPSSTGAKDEPPSAWSPRTQMLYLPAHNLCMDYEGTEANYIEGTPYLGASVKMYSGPGGYRGMLLGWDVAAGKKNWEVRENFPLWSGVLATGGDVVFYGTLDGWFKAVDARTGTLLWQFKVASGVVGNPITYLGPDGKQYVALLVGVGGWIGVPAFEEVSADDPYAALGVVGAVADLKNVTGRAGILYVFSL